MWRIYNKIRHTQGENAECLVNLPKYKLNEKQFTLLYSRNFDMWQSAIWVSHVWG
jgi:hypothetical protein